MEVEAEGGGGFGDPGVELEGFFQGAEFLNAVLQAIAEENNLAETAFLVPCADPETADFDLRWFTPGIEVALCGHATLASGHIILSAASGMERVRFSTLKAGVLTPTSGVAPICKVSTPAMARSIEMKRTASAISWLSTSALCGLPVRREVR